MRITCSICNEWVIAQAGVYQCLVCDRAPVLVPRAGEAGAAGVQWGDGNG